MVEVGVAEAEGGLSRLVDAALQGEEVVLTRKGERVVRLTPLSRALRLEQSLEGEALLEHVRQLRDRLAAEARCPEAADIDADLRAMRGRD